MTSVHKNTDSAGTVPPAGGSVGEGRPLSSSPAAPFAGKSREQGVLLSEDDLHALRTIAARRRVSVPAVIRDAIRAYLDVVRA